MKNITLNILMILAIFISYIPTSFGEELTVNIGSFTKEQMSLWDEKSFKGYTKYQPITDNNEHILKASCKNSASALYRKIKIDLTKTPTLKWSWKVDNIYPKLNDTTKAGDDYTVRVYVLYKYGMFPWNIKVLNYVWANTQPVGSSWENAFSSKAMMIAQKSGTPHNKDIWVEESRNIREDFSKYWGLDVKKINGIAIMTDCDNSKGESTGYYKDIRFTN